MANAPRDDNYIAVLIGVSSSDGVTPVTIYVDPSTHRVLVSAATAGSAGSDTEVQFNDGGLLAGDPGFTYNKTTNVATLVGGLLISGLTASQLLATDASKNLVSLAVATYPSLTEISYVKGVTSAVQTQLGTKAPSASPTFTGTVTFDNAGAGTDPTLSSNNAAQVLTLTGGFIVSDLTASEILATDANKKLVSLAVATYPSLTELSYVKGTTSAIQTQLGNKAPTTAPTFATSITGSYLTVSEILITDASKNIVSAAVATYPSLTELTYLKGVTSAIQTQLGLKAPIATPTLTGSLTLSNNGDFSITTSDQSAGVAGNALVILAGNSGSGTNINGGDMLLKGGWVTGSGTSNMRFYTAGGGSSGTGVGASTEKVRIDGVGRVGIGTTSPGALLDLGLAGTTLGVVRLAGSTSGNVSIQPNVVAGTNTVLTLPATTGTIALGTGTINEITYWTGTNTIGALTVATYPSLTELSYVKGVTSALQTQLNAKAATLSGTINEIAYFNSASTIASLAVATYPSLTELTYVKGVSSAIQTQLGLKAPLASPTFTGTVTVPTPSNDTDAATKVYVDGVAQGLSIKESVQVATDAALPANTYSNGASGVGATLTAIAVGVLTVDGVTVALNDRVLVKNEVAGANNGIYKCTVAGTAGVAYILTRSTNFDQAADIPGAFTFVENGTVNDGAGFVVADAGPFTIGTTAINWIQFSGAGQITAGTGMTKSGNTLNVIGTASRITANADSIDIASDYIGQTSITTLGTIATGVWSGTAVVVAKGGTGATTLTGILVGDGVNAVTAVAGTASQVLRRNAGNTAYEFFTLAAGGDMVLADVQSVTGLKTFDSTKLAVKGSSTGSTAIASANAGATAYTQTLQARDGTVANLDNVTFIGTTSVALNRASATLVLTGITSIDGLAATATALATSRNLWGQAFTGAADVTGSLTAVGDITGGASSMIIQAGTGASRTLTFKTTTAGSVATTALTLAADQSATFANTVNATTFVGALTGTASGNLVSGGVLGTPSSGTLTNVTGLPVAGITASTVTALGVGTLELGHASDTTLSRSAAGVLAVEGIVIPSISSTNTITNKRIEPRVVSAASYTTDTGTSLDVSTTDLFVITAQAGALLFNAPGGTPVQGQKLIIRIKDDATARALTWNAVFRAMGTALPSTTVLSKTLYLGFIYNSTDSTWDLVASAQEA